MQHERVPMRLGWPILMGFAAVAAANGALADPLVLQERPATVAAYAAKPVEQPWQPERPLPTLNQQPIGELIATRLGIAEGSAELFRFRVENAPSDKTMLDGVIDGGGIKLKLTW
jgi:hypothetical protein